MGQRHLVTNKVKYNPMRGAAIAECHAFIMLALEWRRAADPASIVVKKLDQFLEELLVVVGMAEWPGRLEPEVRPTLPGEQRVIVRLGFCRIACLAFLDRLPSGEPQQHVASRLIARSDALAEALTGVPDYFSDRRADEALH